MRPWRKVLILLLVMVLLSGLAIMMYPYIQGAFVDYALEQDAKAFLDQNQKPTEPDETNPQEPRKIIRNRETAQGETTVLISRAPLEIHEQKSWVLAAHFKEGRF